jgi:hypothetical protein
MNKRVPLIEREGSIDIKIGVIDVDIDSIIGVK